MPNERTIGLPPQKKGANKGRSVNINKMVADYWSQFGWDVQTGKPTVEKLDDLGIE